MAREIDIGEAGEQDTKLEPVVRVDVVDGVQGARSLVNELGECLDADAVDRVAGQYDELVF